MNSVVVPASNPVQGEIINGNNFTFYLNSDNSQQPQMNINDVLYVAIFARNSLGNSAISNVISVNN